MVEKICNNYVLNKFPQRDDSANKGSFGKIINIAGSSNYSGAAFLSSKSALKVGAGFLSLACPEEIIQRVSPVLPEITFLPLKSGINGSISNDNIIDNLTDFDVISLGCGLTTNEDTQNFVISLFKQVNLSQKIVIDADGLNILSLNKNSFNIENSIITPHPKELSRLLNVSVDEILSDREKYAKKASETFGCITVLKGHNSLVTNGEKVFMNTTGNSSLAKAGTGDVLTGIISGLLAQKISTFDAAIIAVYLHGLSGDIASEHLTKYSVLATDVIEYIPFAINKILNCR